MTQGDCVVAIETLGASHLSSALQRDAANRYFCTISGGGPLRHHTSLLDRTLVLAQDPGLA